jgi:C-terminal processing protease CtpA/Prc
MTLSLAGCSNDAQNSRVEIEDSPQGVYQFAWKLARDRYFDQEKLKDWGAWEHKYDGKLQTFGDAEKDIGEMYASLGDPFTRVASEQHDARVAALPEAKYGLGVDVAAAELEETAGNVSSRMMPGDIGYMRVVSFKPEDTAKQMYEGALGLKDAKGIVLDLRDNRGGLVDAAIEAATMFLDTGHVVETKDRTPNGIEQKALAVKGDDMMVVDLKDEPVYGKYKRPFPQVTKVPMVILVNKMTASASELFSAALQQNHRAYLIGENTFGKGIGQSIVRMPHDLMIAVTSLRYYTPKHDWLGDGGFFAVGLTPDQTIKPVADSDGDPQLDAAIEYLKHQA